jgi:hypothetical protein
LLAKLQKKNRPIHPHGKGYGAIYIALIKMHIAVDLTISVSLMVMMKVYGDLAIALTLLMRRKYKKDKRRASSAAEVAGQGTPTLILTEAFRNYILQAVTDSRGKGILDDTRTTLWSISVKTREEPGRSLFHTQKATPYLKVSKFRLNMANNNKSFQK